MKKIMILSLMALGSVALIALTANKVAKATPDALAVEVPMVVENRSMDNGYIPEKAVIQFELEDMNELDNTSSSEEMFNRVTTFESFSTGGITFNFGEFDFKKAGIYKYRISQVLHDELSEEENWELDLVSFNISITVVEIDGELIPDITITRDNGYQLTEVSEVRFINTYRPK